MFLSLHSNFWSLIYSKDSILYTICIIGMLYFPFIIHMPKRSYFSSYLQHRISYLLKAISLPFLLFFVLITIGIYFITGRYMMTGHLLMMGKCSWSIMHQIDALVSIIDMLSSISQYHYTKIQRYLEILMKFNPYYLITWILKYLY